MYMYISGILLRCWKVEKCEFCCLPDLVNSLCTWRGAKISWLCTIKMMLRNCFFIQWLDNPNSSQNAVITLVLFKFIPLKIRSNIAWITCNELFIVELFLPCWNLCYVAGKHYDLWSVVSIMVECPFLPFECLASIATCWSDNICSFVYRLSLSLCIGLLISLYRLYVIATNHQNEADCIVLSRHRENVITADNRIVLVLCWMQSAIKSWENCWKEHKLVFWL